MSSKFLLVVLGMSADPFHYHQATQIAHLDHQSIAIALDVEDHPIAGQKIRAAVALFDVLACLPLAAFDFATPRIQRTSGIRMRSLEPFGKWQAEYAHELPVVMSGIISSQKGNCNYIPYITGSGVEKVRCIDSITPIGFVGFPTKGKSLSL